MPDLTPDLAPDFTSDLTPDFTSDFTRVFGVWPAPKGNHTLDNDTKPEQKHTGIVLD